MAHSFNEVVAQEIGIPGAVLLNNIAFWCEKNHDENRNFHDGNFWTYNPVRKFAETFKYLTVKKIRTALNKLIEAGFLMTGNFNKIAYDRTKWYALTDKALKALGMTFHRLATPPICPSGQIESPLSEIGIAPQGEAIPVVVTPDNKKQVVVNDKIAASNKVVSSDRVAVTDNNFMEFAKQAIREQYKNKSTLEQKKLWAKFQKNPEWQADMRESYEESLKQAELAKLAEELARKKATAEAEERRKALAETPEERQAVIEAARQKYPWLKSLLTGAAKPQDATAEEKLEHKQEFIVRYLQPLGINDSAEIDKHYSYFLKHRRLLKMPIFA
jgi:hypothetical protein